MVCRDHQDLWVRQEKTATRESPENPVRRGSKEAKEIS